MAEKKLKYKDVPKALGYVIKTLWKISPGYVLLSLFMTVKNKLLPFVTLFIVADITTRLPDLIQQKQNFMVVIGLLVTLVAIELGDRLFDWFAHSKQKRIEVRVTLHLREYFYKAYARLPYRLYEDKEVIDAFQYADAFMYRFSRFGLQQIARAVGSVVEICVAIFALFTVAWFMPLLFVLFVPFLVVSVLRVNREQARIFLENRGAQRKLWALESLFYPRKIKETRLYGVVDYFLGQRRQYSQKIEMRDVDIAVKRDRMSFWQDVQMQAVSLIASGVAVWRIAYQGAPLGIFVLAQQLTSRAAGAVKALFTEISEFDQDLYGFAEYRYITETLQSPQRDLPVASAQPEITLKGVTFTYPQADKPSLKNISLSIPFGHSLAVVGENGAGKTTFTRLLLGLYHPQKGSVSVNGTPLVDINEQSWLQRIGVLLQDFGMDEDMTVRDAVWLGDITKPKDDALIMKVLEAVELDDVIKKQPHGLDSYLGKWIEEEKGIELSGGQLQRLAIARALFREPDVLILDEPTSAIDANAEERIFSRLMSSRKGKTTIFISHRFSTVRRAEHIAFMEYGKLTEYGTHQELMAKNSKYAHMFTTQAEGYR